MVARSENATLPSMANVETSAFGAIVLAAGGSRRMGRPKPLLPTSEGVSPLIVQILDTLLITRAWPVVVVLGAEAGLIRPVLARRPVQIADNPAWAEGLGSSVRAGLEVVRRFPPPIDGVLLVTCDQPGLSVEAVNALTAAGLANPYGLAATVHPDGGGVPAFFARQHFDALAALSGDRGARDLLRQQPERVALVSRPELILDLDTPAEYRAWLKDERKR